MRGPSWSYGSWIYNYLCNQCLSPITLWEGGVLDTTLCDKICQWLAAGWWFSSGTLVFSTNKTDCHNVTELLLKVALNTINHKPILEKWMNVFLKQKLVHKKWESKHRCNVYWELTNTDFKVWAILFIEEPHCDFEMK